MCPATWNRVGRPIGEWAIEENCTVGEPGPPHLNRSHGVTWPPVRLVAVGRDVACKSVLCVCVAISLRLWETQLGVERTWNLVHASSPGVGAVQAAADRPVRREVFAMTTDGILHDNQLLFGVLCVQCRFVQPEHLVEAAVAWMRDPAESVATRLVEAGTLSDKQRALVESLVEEVIQAHAGDARQSLASFGGERAALDSFGGQLDVKASKEGWGLSTVEQQAIQAAGFGEAATQAAGFGEAAAGIRALDDHVNVTPEVGGRYTYIEKKTLYEQGRRRKTGSVRTAELGRGGMGRVLVTFDEHLGRDVAIKELLPDRAAGAPGSPGRPRESPGKPDSPMARSGKIVARFLREARVTGQLEHPSIVPVYELGIRVDGTLYYAMKLVRGRTLREAIRDCKSLADRLMLLSHVADLCHAIAYAHSRGVVNRDIKPENIMVGEFGETVVLDWGLAKVIGQEDVRGTDIVRDIQLVDAAAQGKTMAEFLGTPNYMPPEQAWGKLEEVDERSDIWSMGAVLYEVLTGRPPFEGVNAFDVVGKVRTDEPIHVLTLSPSAPPDLAAVAMRCLQRESGARYQSASELALDIERYQAGARVEAYHYSSRELLKRFVATNKILSVSVVGASVVLLVATVLVWMQYRKAEQERVNAVEARAVADDNAHEAQHSAEQARANERRARTAERLADDHSADAELSAHMATLARESEESARQEAERLKKQAEGALVRAQGREREAKANLSEALFQKANTRKAESLGGEAMAYAALALQLAERGDARSLFLSLRHQNGKRMLRLHESWGLSLAFSCGAINAQGTLLAAGGKEGTVRVWDLETGIERSRLPSHSSRLLSVTFSSDGLLLASAWADGTVRLWHMTDQSEKAVLSQHAGAVMSIAFSPDGRLLASGGWDGKVLLHSVEGDSPTIELQEDIAGVTSIVFSPCGSLVAAAGIDGTLVVSEVESGRELKRMQRQAAMGSPVAFSSDGLLLTYVGPDGNVRALEVGTDKPHSVLISLPAPGVLVTLPDGGHPAVATDADGNVWVLPTSADSGQAQLLLRSAPRTPVVLSPNGAALAFEGEDRVLRLWDVAAGMEKARLQGHPSSVRSVALSVDGRILASGGDDGVIRLWEMATGRERTRLKGHLGTVLSTDFSPTGARLASGGQDGVVRLWDVASGAQELTLEGHSGPIWSVDFSPDEDLLASAGEDGTVRLWDLKKATQHAQFEDGLRPVWSVAFSPDGRQIASAGFDPVVRIRKVSTGRNVRRIHLQDGLVRSIVFSPDGKLVATGGDASAIRLWDVFTGRPVQSFAGRSDDDVRCLAFSSDGRLLGSGSGSGTLNLWEVATGKELAYVRADSFHVWSIAFLPDAQRLVSGGEDGPIRIWDIGPTSVDPPFLATPLTHVRQAAVAFSPLGHLIAAGGVDGAVHLWDLDNQQEESLLTGHTSGVRSLAFSPDGAVLVSGGRDRTVRLWSMAMRAEIMRLETALTGDFAPVAYSRDGQYVAFGHGQGVVWVWSVPEERKQARLESEGADFTCLAFSPDGKSLALGTLAGTVELWDVPHGKHYRTLASVPDAVGSILAVAFAPEGTTLATADAIGLVRLWDVDTGASRAWLVGHSGEVPSVAFSDEGSTLASGGLDRTVRLWDVATRTELARLENHTEWVLSVAFSPDDHTVAALDALGVRLWDLSDLRTSGRALAERVLRENQLVAEGTSVKWDAESPSSRFVWTSQELPMPAAWWERSAAEREASVAVAKSVRSSEYERGRYERAVQFVRNRAVIEQIGSDWGGLSTRIGSSSECETSSGTNSSLLGEYLEEGEDGLSGLLAGLDDIAMQLAPPPISQDKVLGLLRRDGTNTPPVLSPEDGRAVENTTDAGGPGEEREKTSNATSAAQRTKMPYRISVAAARAFIGERQDERAIRSYVKEQSSAFVECFLFAVRDDSEAGGKLVLRVMVDANGKSSARVLRDTTGNVAVVECMLGKVRQWTPPTSKGKATSFTVPIELQSTDK